MAKPRRTGTQTAATYAQLERTFHAIDRAHERWLAAVGSSGARAAVLIALAGGRAMTPSDISDATRRSPNAVSPLLSALQAEGLIKRTASLTDRRSHHVALTAAGRRLVQRLAREEAAFVRAALGKQAARDLVALTTRLAALEEQALAIQRPQ